MSAAAHTHRSARSTSRGRRHVRSLADDVAHLIERAEPARRPAARDTVERHAYGGGAAEVITVLSERTPAPARARPHGIRIEQTVEIDRPPVVDDDLRARLQGAQTTSLLLVGGSGWGKTTLARWLAHRRGRPLATLDLATTGDRSAASLAGEIRRGTTAGMTLFIDNAHLRGPAALSLLVGVAPEPWTVVASEAPDAAHLVDQVVTLELPDIAAIEALLRTDVCDVDARTGRVLAALSLGETPASIVRGIERARRFSSMTEVSVPDALRAVTLERFSTWSPRRRSDAALALLRLGDLSQRAVSAVTGVSRDTLRRRGAA
ncbi:hypothetical protein [Microbacterium sp. BH-3-3-3]|uniref:hypothetical protein n=1 Tax=Microbacterium sp. BH-3-3-3 TaxID=1906742 RepID=UPI000AC299C9|nr:hypothetical protein [Microbacterium sp. BH-3-3-3]